MANIPPFVQEYMSIQKHKEDMRKSYIQQKNALEKQIYELEQPVKEWLATHPNGEVDLLGMPEPQRQVFGNLRAIRIRETEETSALTLAVLDQLVLGFFQQYFKDEWNETQIRQMAQLCTEFCWSGRKRYKRVSIHRVSAEVRPRPSADSKRKMLRDRIHIAIRDASSDD